MKAYQNIRQKTGLALTLILLINVCFWFGARDILPKWPGVPPAPSEKTALSGTLGDRQFAYRLWALSLQNFGDTGGQVTSLKSYDYQKLDPWFELLYEMDPQASHIPLIIAYYFGAVRDKPESIKVVIKHLARIGNSNEGEKWRWLAQAVFLARHRLNDLPYATQLAHMLSRLNPENSELPHWARHMPAILHADMGEDEMAVALMDGLLRDSQNLSPNELNFMLSFMEERLGVDVKQRYGLTGQ